MFAVIRAIRNRMPDFTLTGDPRNIKIRTQHVEGIHKKKAEVVNQIAANSCPKCGGGLIARKGKYGESKGCNNYLKCRFTITS
ncbi:hypothetical protein SBF1_7020001 [Candidatus Desulfosporosinus infrequens]|uniref:DNA topoisomerase type IA zn finger domain-containing protein n=1 Tax=Candidatus Desulfosporosinus infrequens TaxID=2043169 RepID=A0A2U3LPP8_9FIRM|nr:hypothetical protein SBF1_7020001 [Candidatus Desulfosporosinus infrequens]